MSLIETKIEVDLTSAFKEALNLGKHFDSQYRIKAFRKFIKNVDDDYKTFCVAGVDVMPLHEAIALVQAGAPCVQVAKLVARGALETTNPDDDEQAKQIWYALTDLTFQFSGLAIAPAELSVMATLRNGDALCRGPFNGFNRADMQNDIPKDLINEALFAVLEETPNAAVSWTSNEADGKEWVPCEGFNEHPHREDVLAWYERTQNEEFVDLSVFIEMCKHAKEKNKDEHIHIFDQFMQVQRLILNAHDIISLFAGTTKLPENRMVALKAQQRAKPVPITYATTEIKGLAKKMTKLSVDVLKKLPQAISDYRLFSPPRSRAWRKSHRSRALARSRRGRASS